MRNTVVVDGIGDLRDVFALVLEDGWQMGPPEPVMRIVDVPGGPPLDLTDAMGGPFYGSRDQKFTFGLTGAAARLPGVEIALGRIRSALHNRRLRYSVTMDPGHTYEGRWSVGEVTHVSPLLATVEMSVVADPYRYRPMCTYKLNPIGGRWYRMESGDMPVRPTIECATPVRVDFKGRSTLLPAGTWRLNDVLFERGWNDIYLNSWEVRDTSLSRLAQHTLDELSQHTLDELQRLFSGGVDIGRTLEDLRRLSLADMSQIALEDLPYATDGGASEVAPPVDATIYMQYEWGDL